MYIRVPLLCFLVPGTEKRDYPFNFLRGIFFIGPVCQRSKVNLPFETSATEGGYMSFHTFLELHVEMECQNQKQ